MPWKEYIMKVTWLGQAGLLFDSGRVRVLVDPYLSDSIGDTDPERHRRIPVPEDYKNISADILVITNTEPDRLDDATLMGVLGAERRMTVLCSEGAYNRVRHFSSRHNYVLLSPHSVWSEGGLTFYSVRAEHHDRTAIGVIIDDGERTFYLSGDTLYNYDVIDDVMDLVDDGVDYAFLPINGYGNNMNAKDASDFAYELDAGRAVPVHYGMLDDVSPESFDFEDAFVLTPFQPTEL